MKIFNAYNTILQEAFKQIDEAGKTINTFEKKKFALEQKLIVAQQNYDQSKLDYYRVKNNDLVDMTTYKTVKCNAIIAKMTLDSTKVELLTACQNIDRVKASLETFKTKYNELVEEQKKCLDNVVKFKYGKTQRKSARSNKE